MAAGVFITNWLRSLLFGGEAEAVRAFKNKDLRIFEQTLYGQQQKGEAPKRYVFVFKRIDPFPAIINNSKRGQLEKVA